MKNYYFVGGKGAVSAEILKILQENNLPYKRVEAGEFSFYPLEEKDTEQVKQQGYFPIAILCSCSSSTAECWNGYCYKHNASPLERLAAREQIELSDWQNLVLFNDEDRYKEYPYSTQIMADLCRYGSFSRGEIDKVRAYDRREKGISEEEELATEHCLDTYCSKQRGLLIVTNLPHKKYRAVLDRAFWLQPLQNIVIFTQEKTFLYAGFADICFHLMREGYVQTCYFCYSEGSYKTAEEQQKIIQKLTALSRLKKIDGLL